ncbi:hypothetical protein, partial [Bradyrhizobium sp. NBAIM08]|uniref:hypothetical protein n=1 Tax=Bradyrhizobium sp. NBAIM08 TaxID=2793815 RepID=UPI001CD238EC
MVEHTGTGPFTYQWYFDGFDFITTTSNQLDLPAVNFYYNGQISVEVRNAVGFELSSNAALVVLSPPFLVTPLSSRQALRGMDVTLAAGLLGNTPFYTSWSRDGLVLPGT